MKKLLINGIIILAYIVIIAVLGYIALTVTHWLFKAEHDGFAGNFIGGVIGGLVAYIIARYQIYIQNKAEKRNTKKLLNASLVALSTEVNNNLLVINAILGELSSSIQKLRINISPPLDYSVWENIMLADYFIVNMKAADYEVISRAYASLKVFKLLNNTEISSEIFTEFRENLLKVQSIVKLKLGEITC